MTILFYFLHLFSVLKRNPFGCEELGILVFGLRLCCALALMTYAAVKWGLGLGGTVIIEGL